MITYDVMDKNGNLLHVDRIYSEDEAIQLAKEKKGWILENSWGIVRTQQIANYLER